MPSPQDAPATLVPVAMASGREECATVEAACLALQAVEAYGTLTGLGATSPVRALVVDLVADLMHLCAQSGISFEAVSEEAALIVESDCAQAVA